MSDNLVDARPPPRPRQGIADKKADGGPGHRDLGPGENNGNIPAFSANLGSSMATRPLVTLLLCAFMSMHAPQVAWAQESAADRLFREGREATKRQDHKLACQKFNESYRLDPAPGTLVNLGECEEKLGQVRQAWRHLNEALKQLPASDNRVPIVRSLLDGLSKKIARLTLLLPGDEDIAKVVVDTIEVPEAERRVPVVVEPGEHEVVASAEDGREARQTVRVAPGQNAEVRLKFHNRSSGHSRPPSKKQTRPQNRVEALEEDPGSSQRFWAYTAGAVGLVGLGAGTFFYVKNTKAYDEGLSKCKDGPRGDTCGVSRDDEQRVRDLQNEAKSARAWSIITYTAGGLAIGVATLLLVTAPASTDKAISRPSWNILPIVSRNEGGISLGGSL